MAVDRSRRPTSVMDAAEAAFKSSVAKAPEPAPKKPVIPHAKELVSLRIDQDVLAFFQEQGAGWQDRLNAVLRKAAGLDEGGEP